ncbi:MAG: metal ABC transporter substrate-binding protein [Chloroflexota bacterium]
MRMTRPLLRLDIDQGRRTRLAGTAAATVALALLVTATPALGQSPVASDAPGTTGTAPAHPDIVVTTAVLGAVVTELVGDRGTVQVLMPPNVDPHEWSPSAQDIETLHGADLVVASGLGIEAALADPLAEVAGEGIPVFTATDHITPRTIAADDPAAGEAVGGQDPHFWTDPVAMKAVVDALAPAIGDLGVDLADRQADLDGRLDALDAEVRAQIEAIPADHRKLVTGHESLGYFADRYGLQLIGAVVPGLSSQGEVSARELADIAGRIRDAGVTVIFTELGTPQSVVDAIAGETGVRVVQLASHTLPADGSYFSYIRDLASTIAGALG